LGRLERKKVPVGSEKFGRCCDFAAFTASLGVPLPFGPGGVPVGSLADEKHRRARGAKELVRQGSMPSWYAVGNPLGLDRHFERNSEDNVGCGGKRTIGAA
jgi:hypothetical protein